MTLAASTRRPAGHLRYPCNTLVSYHYAQGRDDLLNQLATGGLRLIGDSGAYSAYTAGVTIDLDKFGEWSRRNRHLFCWVASLDERRNDPVHNFGTYTRLRRVHGVDVVPTIHAGDDSHYWVDRYADDGVDFLGLGGLVSHRTRPLATLPWLADVMSYAERRHPGMRFHGWGVTNPKLLMMLPYFSADSSSATGSYRWGRLALWDPGAGAWVKVRTDTSALEHHELLHRVYAVDTARCTWSDRSNRRMWVRLGALSFQLYEDHLRARHGPITAPRYGLADDLPGPHVHLVDANVPALRLLCQGGAV